MDRSTKLELLDQQIAAAQDGQPGDFDVWRQTTDVVLRAVLGDASPLYASFKEIRYGLSNSFGFGGTNAALVMKRFDE